MKTILALSYGVFFTGLALKFFHVHFNAIWMLVGLAGIFIASLASIFRKKDGFVSYLSLAIFGWLILLFLSVKFLPFQTVFLILASISSLLVIIFAAKKKKLNKVWPLGVSLVLALLFYLLPTDERYQILNIRWNYEIETDYITWDKYSWFLYQNGKYEEALDASEKASGIANELDDEQWSEFIDRHSLSIKDRNWERYRE